MSVRNLSSWRGMHTARVYDHTSPELTLDRTTEIRSITNNRDSISHSAHLFTLVLVVLGQILAVGFSKSHVFFRIFLVVAHVTDIYLRNQGTTVFGGDKNHLGSNNYFYVAQFFSGKNEGPENQVQLRQNICVFGMFFLYVCVHGSHKWPSKAWK